MMRNIESATKACAAIISLAGAWFFVSPWVYGVQAMANAWNNWIVGALIVVLAVIHMANPISARAIGYFNLFLGAWVVASPWIFGYIHMTDRMVNSLCAGAVVFVAAIVGSSIGHTTAMPPRLHT